MKRLIPGVSLLVTVVGMLASGAVRGQSGRAEPGRPRTSRAPASITGWVIGSNGERVANIHVTLNGLNQLDHMRNREATTSADGKFEFENVARGVYTVAAFGREYSEPATCRPGDSLTLRVGTQKGGVITGRVTTGNGKPAIEAPVRAIRLRDYEGRSSISMRWPFENVTDDRGIYRLWGLPPGYYILSAGGRSRSSDPRPYDNEPQTYFPSNSAETATEVTLSEAEERTGLDIRLREWDIHSIRGKVSGAIENSSDRSYSGVMLWNLLTGPMQSQTQPLSEQGTGEFQFEALAAGDYCLQALAIKERDLTGASSVVHVALKESDITGVELKLRRSASISARVLVESPSSSASKACSDLTEPVIEETLISLLREDRPRQDTVNKCEASSSLVKRMFSGGGDVIARVTPDSRGEVSFRPSEAGRYRIQVEPPNDNYYLKAITLPQAGANRPADVGRSGVAITDGAVVSGVVITLAPGAAAFSGSVVSPQPATKLPSSITVLLVPAEPQSADDVLRFAETPVTSDGAFTFKNVVPGRYFLLVRREQVAPPGEIAVRQHWWNPNLRASLRLEAEKANARIDLRLCERVKNHVLVYTGN